MSPSHANKQGVRYRYYVSQALIQGRKEEAGSVGRVSGPDLEEQILAELRSMGTGGEASDWDLVTRWVERITLEEERIEIKLRADAQGGQQLRQCQRPAQARLEL
jgi:site-specific DNA recombinase